MFCTISDMCSGGPGNEAKQGTLAEEVAWVNLYTCLCYALAIKTITYHNTCSLDPRPTQEYIPLISAPTLTLPETQCFSCQPTCDVA